MLLRRKSRIFDRKFPEATARFIETKFVIDTFFTGRTKVHSWKRIALAFMIYITPVITIVRSKNFVACLFSISRQNNLNFLPFTGIFLSMAFSMQTLMKY